MATPEVLQDGHDDEVAPQSFGRNLETLLISVFVVNPPVLQKVRGVKASLMIKKSPAETVKATSMAYK